MLIDLKKRQTVLVAPDAGRGLAPRILTPPGRSPGPIRVRPPRASGVNPDWTSWLGKPARKKTIGK